MCDIQFVKSRRMIAVEALANPHSTDYREKEGLVEVEELTDDGRIVLVQQPGSFLGQTWEYGKPYTWCRLPTMYELPSEGPEWEDVHELQQQLQQERQLREQAELKVQALSQRLRELGEAP